MPVLYLINPDNPVVSLSKVRDGSRLNRFRVWKPLGLLLLARMTPDPWEVRVLDENLGRPDYDSLPRPDLVGITAFTSQATRAYEVARRFRREGVPVVMGGIHATLCRTEALEYVDAVVLNEAETVWPRVLRDVERGCLDRLYHGGQAPMDQIPAARHDLEPGRYYFGSIQTTRGCPLSCSFCSVTAFNGRKFRHRPVENILEELRQIRERMILFVDDNLIGTRRDHMQYAKDLFRGMIREGLTTPWIGQVTINFADDEELLDLATRAGCHSVFIGFESPTEEGLIAVRKKFNLAKGRDFRRSVERIRRAGIVVVGSFILGIDTDRPGIGTIMAEACEAYGVDMANVLLLTPLPGTELYDEMAAAGRITADRFPDDWQYYTFAYPVARYANFTWDGLQHELDRFHEIFYSYPRVIRRTLGMARRTRSLRKTLFGLVGNLSYRGNQLRDQKVAVGRSPATTRSPGATPVRPAPIAAGEGMRPAR